MLAPLGVWCPENSIGHVTSHVTLHAVPNVCVCNSFI